MKNAIFNLLKNGYYNGKKYTLDDMLKKLYFLKYIARADGGLQVMTSRNKFWDHTNNSNRIDLLHDLYSVHQFKLTDNAYFHIINRFENGDAYGIAREE